MNILNTLRCTFLVIDFEALTPTGRPAEPTEVAAMALVVRDGKLVEDGRFESLIRPPADVPVTQRDNVQPAGQGPMRPGLRAPRGRWPPSARRR